MPNDPFVIPATQIPAAPQPQTNLPALLSAIGGAVLNGAGLFTGQAHGTSSLSLAQQLQQQANEKQRTEYEQQVKQTKQEQRRNVGEQLKARAGEIWNPAAQNEIKSMADNDMLEAGIGVFNAERTNQHWLSQQKKGDKKEADRDFKYLLSSFDDRIHQGERQMKDANARLGRDFAEEQKAILEHKIFSESPKFFDSPRELMDTYNATVKKNGFPKINEKDAQDMWSRYKQFAPGSIARLKATFGQAQLPSPQEAFQGYLDARLTPEQVDNLKKAQEVLAEHRKQIDTLYSTRQALKDPRTKEQTLKQLYSGEAPAPSVGPGSRPAAPPAGAPPADPMVSVVSPEGVPGQIPQSKLEAAKKRGFKVAK